MRVKMKMCIECKNEQKCLAIGNKCKDEKDFVQKSCSNCKNHENEKCQRIYEFFKGQFKHPEQEPDFTFEKTWYCADWEGK